MNPRNKLIGMSPEEKSIYLYCYTPCSKVLNVVRDYITVPNCPTYNENDMDVYLKLLDGDILVSFFKQDGCCRLADKYLIAMVFTYFMRAGYTHSQFTDYNFFVALYLAHDIEEDDEELKTKLYVWALGPKWDELYLNLVASRDELWRKMGHRGIVSRTCCEKVMSLCPDYPAWKRTRAEVHAGADRGSIIEITEKSGLRVILENHGVCWNCCKLKAAIESEDKYSETAFMDWDTSSEESSAATIVIESSEEEYYKIATKCVSEE